MFYISISNGLIEGDHHEKMGNAIWLYMWLIDKVTKIDDEGLGWVLGGKPLQIEEIKHIPRRSCQRYISILKKNQYITVTRTMRGVIIKVTKAKKSFGRQTRHVPKVAHLDMPELAHGDTKIGASQTKIGASNKTVQYDSTVGHSETSSHTDVVDVIDSFKPVNPAYQKWFAIPPQRKAIERMIKIHGKEQILKVVAILPKSNTIPYLPIITTPIQLEDKWATLAAGLIKEKEKITNKNKVAFS